MNQESCEQRESYDSPDDLEVLQLVEDVKTEYKIESLDLIPRDFESPDIGESFVEDRLAISKARIENVARHINQNYSMRSKFLEEIEDELRRERRDLVHIKDWQLGWKDSVDSRKRSLETRIQDLQKRRRDMEEHLEDKLFSLRRELLELMPEYLSLKRIQGVLNAAGD